MTLAAQAETLGKMPWCMVELDLDVVTSATSAYAADGTPCYNTPETSRDPAWQTGFTTSVRTLRFGQQNMPPPYGMASICHPCLVDAQWTDDRLELGRGMGQFGELNVVLQDFQDNDRTEDPYYDSRTTKPGAGSFFRRLIRRVRYFHGRTIRLLWGFWSKDWTAADFETRTYRIHDVSGPDADGRVTIRAVGPLAFLKLSEKESPPQLGGKLAANLAAGALSFSLDSDTLAADYPASGIAVLSNSELVDYTRALNVFTLSSRGQEGTTDQDHTAGSSVEPCLLYEDITPSEVIRDLLWTQAGLASSYQDAAEWDAIRDGWFKAVKINRTVLAQAKPTMDLVQELCVQFGIYVWYDAVNKKIRIDALRPPSPVGIPTWDDAGNLLEPMQITVDFSSRVSRVDVYGGLRTPVEPDNDPKSYVYRLVGITEGEGSTEHQEPSRKVWLSRWVDRPSVGIITRGTAATVAQLGDGRVEWSVVVPAADIVDLELGESVYITSKDLVDYAGSTETRLAVVVAIAPIEIGHTYRVTLSPSTFAGRWAWAAENGLPTYTSATAVQRDPSCFAADGTTGLMPNGDAGYRVQ